MSLLKQNCILIPDKHSSLCFGKEKTILFFVVFVLFLCSSLPSGADSNASVEAGLKTINNDPLKNDYKGPFQHPYHWKKTDIKALLGSIRYSLNFLTWQNPRPLFSDPWAENLGKKLRQLYSKANSRQVIIFEINLKHVTIAGETFLNKQGINWKINRLSHLSESFQRTGIWEDNWKLSPRKGQYYGTYEDALGLKTEDPGWIFIPRKNIDTFVLRFKEELPGKTKLQRAKPTIPFNGAEFLKKLRHIKSQYRVGALNREQYFHSLNQIIQSSGWNKLPISPKMEIFEVINREHLFPRKPK